MGDVHSSERLSEAWEPALPTLDLAVMSSGSLRSVIAGEESEGLAHFFIMWCYLLTV